MVASSSTSIIDAEPLVQPGTLAVTLIERLPSTTWSSCMIKQNCAVVWPASRTTVGGTVKPVVSLEASCTVMLAAGATLDVTTPVSCGTSVSSGKLAGRLTVSEAVWSSWMVIVPSPGT